MLDDQLKTQLSAYLERVQQPFELVASLNDSDTSREMLELLQTIQSLRSDKITLRTDGNDARKPSFTLQRVGSTSQLRFAGLPLGHEFTSLVLALLWTGGHPPKAEQEVLDQIDALEGDFNFEVYMSLSCHNCPDVVQALSLMAIRNPRIKTTVIEGGAFQEEVNRREVMAVPMVFLNGQVFGSGRMLVEEIVAKIDTGAAQRDAAKLSAKDPYEVLIVGGGPAGAAGCRRRGDHRLERALRAQPGNERDPRYRHPDLSLPGRPGRPRFPGRPLYFSSELSPESGRRWFPPGYRFPLPWFFVPLVPVDHRFSCSPGSPVFLVHPSLPGRPLPLGKKREEGQGDWGEPPCQRVNLLPPDFSVGAVGTIGGNVDVVNGIDNVDMTSVDVVGCGSISLPIESRALRGNTDGQYQGCRSRGWRLGQDGVARRQRRCRNSGSRRQASCA